MTKKDINRIKIVLVENKRTAKWLADELGKDPATVSNMQSLLRPGITFNASDAYLLIYETFIDKMEGKRG